MTDGIAFAAVITSGIVGLAGVLASFLASERVWKGQRGLTREERTFEARVSLYTDILARHLAIAAAVEADREGDRQDLAPSAELLARAEVVASDRVFASVLHCEVMLVRWRRPAGSDTGTRLPEGREGESEPRTHGNAEERYRRALATLREQIRHETHGPAGVAVRARP